MVLNACIYVVYALIIQWLRTSKYYLHCGGHPSDNATSTLYFDSIHRNKKWYSVGKSRTVAFPQGTSYSTTSIHGTFRRTWNCTSGLAAHHLRLD